VETIVDVGPYRGVFGTIWSIVREEQAQNMEIVPGVAGSPATRRTKIGARKGQGVEGLWRGWRVGMWGIVVGGGGGWGGGRVGKGGMVGGGGWSIVGGGKGGEF